MEVKQVIFEDDDGNIFGGILVDDEFVICGCCGGVFDIKEGLIKIIKTYSDWVNISDSI